MRSYHGAFADSTLSLPPFYLCDPLGLSTLTTFVAVCTGFRQYGSMKCAVARCLNSVFLMILFKLWLGWFKPYAAIQSSLEFRRSLAVRFCLALRAFRSSSTIAALSADGWKN